MLRETGHGTLDCLVLTGSIIRDLEEIHQWSAVCVFSEIEPGDSVLICD